jgi:hypothetical protein
MFITILRLRSATYDVEDSADRVSRLSGIFRVVGGHGLQAVCYALDIRRMLAVYPIRDVDQAARHRGWCGCSMLG